MCLEATGRYSRDVAAFLYAEGYAVSLVNPTRVSHYRQACGQLHKTDKQDAKLLTEYCTTHHPPLWTPPTFAQEEWQEMTRYLESLKKEKTRVLNRLASGPFTQWVQRDLQEQLAQLKQRIAELEQEIKQVATQDDEQRRQIALLTSIKASASLPPCVSSPKRLTIAASPTPTNWPPMPALCLNNTPPALPSSANPNSPKPATHTCAALSICPPSAQPP